MDNPSHHPIVILKDVTFADLRTMVDFMYYGEVNVTEEQLPQVRFSFLLELGAMSSALRFLWGIFSISSNRVFKLKYWGEALVKKRAMIFSCMYNKHECVISFKYFFFKLCIIFCLWGFFMQTPLDFF